MSTTFANQINNLDIYAARAVADKDGNQLDTTYAKSADLATVATTGDYTDLTNKPTIPAALSAGDGVDITNNVVSAKVDGTTIVVNQNTGELEALIGSPDVFIADYDVTPYDDVDAAVQANKSVFVKYPYSPSEESYSLIPFVLQNTGLSTYEFIMFQGFTDNYRALQIRVLKDYSTGNTRWYLTTYNYANQTEYSTGLSASTGALGITTVSVTNPLPSSSASDADKVLTVDSNGDAAWVSPSYGLFEAIYGQTSYADIVAAINAHKIVYCRISATGASRMAFLAYIGTSNVEFQYYRSLNSHSASNQTDEVYVYTVSSSGWTTTTRLTGIKYAAGTHMTSSFANNTLTFQSVWPDVDQTYDATSANAQSGTAVAGALTTKEDAFDVGTGLEMDTSGSTPTLQVEAPVDIVAGPGIAIDNPDGNTLRISSSDSEVVLYDANGSPSQSGPWQLTELRTNFKWLDIVFGTDTSGNEVKVQRFKASSPYMKLEIPRYDEDPSWKVSMMTLTFNQTTMSIRSNSIARYTVSSAGAVSVSTAAAQAPYIYQVIGVGRIANT